MRGNALLLWVCQLLEYSRMQAKKLLDASIFSAYCCLNGTGAEGDFDLPRSFLFFITEVAAMPQKELAIVEAKKMLEDSERVLNRSAAAITELRASIERSRAIVEARGSNKREKAPANSAPAEQVS
jgi:hypothetical protein